MNDGYPYKRITKTICELAEEEPAKLKENPEYSIHDGDQDLVEIDVGYLRDLEDLFYYCEKALPFLKKFYLIKRMFSEDILGEEKKTCLETEEGVLYANIDFALCYLCEHSKEYHNRDMEDGRRIEKSDRISEGLNT
jgi:hypothetical protein